MPGFEALARASLGRLQDSFALRRMLGQAKPVEQEHPRFALIWRDVQATLDAPEQIPLLVGEGDTVNGFTMGLRSPHVVITEGAIRQLPEAHVRAILAHELGHVMSGHVLYKTLVRMLDAGRWWMGASGLNLVLTLPILLALYEWDRKSELSADRAELLVVGDAQISVSVLRACHAGIKEKTEQRYARIAEVWKPGADAIAALERAFSRHPPVEERIAEVEAWAASPELAAIRSGVYPRRSADRTDVASFEARVAELSAGLKAGVEGATERLTTQGEVATAWLAEAGSTAADRGSAVLDWLAERTGGGEEQSGDDS